MAPANYYSKKELAKIGAEGFAILDDHNYGRGRNARRPQFPNYGGGHATYFVTSRPLPPPAAVAAAPFVAGNHYSAASSSGGGYSRRHQYQSYNYYNRYSPAESHVGWAPAADMTAETATVVRGGYEAGNTEMLMNNYKY
nr:uncharacterized protein LOC109176261 [Ipomoea trifida]